VCHSWKSWCNWSRLWFYLFFSTQII